MKKEAHKPIKMPVIPKLSFSSLKKPDEELGNTSATERDSQASTSDTKRKLSLADFVIFEDKSLDSARTNILSDSQYTSRKSQDFRHLKKSEILYMQKYADMQQGFAYKDRPLKVIKVKFFLHQFQ